MAAIVRTWPLVSLDAKPIDYRFIVYDDGTLWMATGKDDKNAWQTDYDVINGILPEILTTLATVNATLAVDQIKKVITVNGSSITLHCDLPVNHSQSFHHDAVTGIYWVADS